MSDKHKHILSNHAAGIDQETLLLYLNKKLPEEKMHEVEMKLLENKFENEAVDGLQEMKDKDHINHMVAALNRDLKKKLAKKKNIRDRKRIKDQPWLYISIIILLALIVLSYLIIRRMLNQ